MDTGAFVVGAFVVAMLMVAFSFAQDDRDGRVKLLLLSTVIGVICGWVTSKWINGEFHRLIESGLSIDGVKESLIGFAVVGVFLLALLALSNEPRPGNISIGWSGVMVLLMFYLSSAAFIKKPSDDFKLQSSIVQSETVIYENNLNVTYTYVDDDGTINLDEQFDFKDLSTTGKMYAEKNGITRDVEDYNELDVVFNGIDMDEEIFEWMKQYPPKVKVVEIKRVVYDETFEDVKYSEYVKQHTNTKLVVTLELADSEWKERYENYKTTVNDLESLTKSQKEDTD
jgi:hypothetical protein